MKSYYLILPAIILCLQTINSQDFEVLPGVSLTGIRSSAVSWGDYDNDGDLDILISGEYNPDEPIVDYNDGVTEIYTNNGDNTFSKETGIVKFRSSGILWQLRYGCSHNRW